MRTSCSSLVAYLILDAIAVYPRYMADAYAAYWRRAKSCALPEAWRPDACADGVDGGALPIFLQVRAGILSVDLHQTWHGADAPMLRRPDGCIPFA